MSTTAIFVEKRNQDICNVGLELISETKRLLNTHHKVIALYLTSEIKDEEIQALSSAGADQIIIYQNELLKVYDTSIYTKALENIVKTYHFDCLLLGSTLIGRDLGPRLSARLHTGLTADATILAFEEEDNDLRLLATRPALGGNLFATIICPKTKPQMATIRPGVFPVDFYENHQAELIYFNQVIDVKPSVQILNIEKTEKSHTDLTKAKLIVAGGRGVQKSFSTLKDIANLVGGELAASRAIVDQAIEPKDRLVGQTGTTVRPQVYIASGISGAIQHVSGMDKSELIIAINTDPDALIFDVADVSIISDANQVLPLLKEELSHQHQHE